MTDKQTIKRYDPDEVRQIVYGAISVLRRAGFIVLLPDGPGWTEAVERTRQSLISDGVIYPGRICIDAALRAAAMPELTEEQS